MENLEPNEVVEEPGVSETEPVAEVSKQATEVSGAADRTFSKAELDGMLQAAEREWQSRKDKEFATLQNRIGDLTRDAEQSRLEAAERERLLEAGVDEDVIKEFQEKRREVDRAHAFWNDKFREGYAYNIASEYKVSPNDLLECNSIEEMEAKAKTLVSSGEVSSLKTRIADLEEQLAAASKEAQKVDSGITNAGSPDMNNMSESELIRYGLSRRKK